MELFTLERIKGEPDCECGRSHHMVKMMATLMGGKDDGKSVDISNWPIPNEYFAVLVKELELLLKTNETGLDSGEMAFIILRIAERLEKDGHDLAPLARLVAIGAVLRDQREKTTINMVRVVLGGDSGPG